MYLTSGSNVAFSLHLLFIHFSDDFVNKILWNSELIANSFRCFDLIKVVNLPLINSRTELF